MESPPVLPHTAPTETATPAAAANEPGLDAFALLLEQALAAPSCAASTGLREAEPRQEILPAPPPASEARSTHAIAAAMDAALPPGPVQPSAAGAAATELAAAPALQAALVRASEQSVAALAPRLRPDADSAPQPFAASPPPPEGVPPPALREAPGSEPGAFAVSAPPPATAAPASPHAAPLARPPAANGTAAPAGVPLAAPGWDGALAHALVRIVREQQPRAEIRVEPPELGPIEVRLALGGSETEPVANIQLAAPHPLTREALEAALPALRAALAEAGITLGQATVSEEQPRGDRGRAASARSGTPAAEPPAEAAVQVAPVAGRVDTYV
jgi:hypothetical protein